MSVQLTYTDHYHRKVKDFVSTWFFRELSAASLSWSPERWRGEIVFVATAQDDFSYDGQQFSVGDEVAIVASTLELMPAENLYRESQEQ